MKNSMHLSSSAASTCANDSNANDTCQSLNSSRCATLEASGGQRSVHQSLIGRPTSAKRSNRPKSAPAGSRSVTSDVGDKYWRPSAPSRDMRLFREAVLQQREEALVRCLSKKIHCEGVAQRRDTILAEREADKAESDALEKERMRRVDEQISRERAHQRERLGDHARHVQDTADRGRALAEGKRQEARDAHLAKVRRCERQENEHNKVRMQQLEDKRHLHRHREALVASRLSFLRDQEAQRAAQVEYNIEEWRNICGLRQSMIHELRTISSVSSSDAAGFALLAQKCLSRRDAVSESAELFRKCLVSVSGAHSSTGLERELRGGTSQILRDSVASSPVGNPICMARGRRAHVRETLPQEDIGLIAEESPTSSPSASCCARTWRHTVDASTPVCSIKAGHDRLSEKAGEDRGVASPVQPSMPTGHGGVSSWQPVVAPSTAEEGPSGREGGGLERRSCTGTTPGEVDCKLAALSPTEVDCKLAALSPTEASVASEEASIPCRRFPGQIIEVRPTRTEPGPPVLESVDDVMPEWRSTLLALSAFDPIKNHSTTENRLYRDTLICEGINSSNDDRLGGGDSCQPLSPAFATLNSTLAALKADGHPIRKDLHREPICTQS